MRYHLAWFLPELLHAEVPRKAISVDPPSVQSRRGEEVLDTLEEIVLAQGFARLGVTTIAARTSCSKRTLYELAPSRDALVQRVLARFFARIRDEAQAAIARCSAPDARVHAYLQAGVRAAERLSPAAVADIHGWPPARAIWQDHVRQRVDGLSRLIEDGIAAGAFRPFPPAFVAEVVFASINRLREPDFYRSTDLSISAAFDELYEMLLAALTSNMRRARATATTRAGR